MDHHFIKGRDIIMFASQPWQSEIGSNFIDMTHELARYNRVLFINRAADRAQLFRNRKNKEAIQNIMPPEKINAIHENLWVYDTGLILESINWITGNKLYDFINKTNNKRLAKKINKAVHKLGFKDVILINDNDFFRGLYLKKYVSSSSTYIFYIRDFLTIQPYFQKHGTRLEKQMFRNSDLVVANSAYLAGYAREYNPHSYDIGQGCDFKGFISLKPSKPADLEDIPGPIIGYCGAITSMRLDEEIIREIATGLPQCNIVLVGPTNPGFEQSDLKKYKNVHFLGAKPPESVPAYLTYFDICINPQLINPLTIGNYPRKIDEYLVLGKPTVATNTLAMEMFKDYVYLCEDKEAYVNQIQTILNDPSAFSEEARESRKKFALSHTWENSIGALGDAYFRVKGL